jgi:hypothetical protein
MERVHIEFRRVQSWLFGVPRLRAMVGANTLLGEVLRRDLPALARASGAWSLVPAARAGDYPAAHPEDPIRAHDDPRGDAAAGIIARDGGHFEATFATGAAAFAAAAERLLRDQLPGLRFRIKVAENTQPTATAHLSPALPVFSPCVWTGHGVGSRTIGEGPDRVLVSEDVYRRDAAARRSSHQQAEDLASLLGNTTELARRQRPNTFEELADPGYLALVHADGNGVGSAAPADDDAALAAFFHRNRVLLRRAAKAAIDDACSAQPDHAAAPLIPLMLGGDDLLVVCRAATALPFVACLCRQLHDLQPEPGGGGTSGNRLTLGVGVVFARPSVPIHRLHQVAEALAGSAKRRFRGFATNQGASVVDWAVYSTAWADDPDDIRRRDWLRGSAADARVLSQRPLNVLGDGLDSLEGLLGAAGALEKAVAAPDQGAARSQLRFLVDQLPKGRSLADLAFAELAPATRQALVAARVDCVWTRATRQAPWITAVLDLVELSEIGRLGRARTAATAPGTCTVMEARRVQA